MGSHRKLVAPCRHCRGEKIIHVRGLCRACYRNPAVRALYPPRVRVWDHEPTADEVERMVAEQYRCLPSWWEKEKPDARY